MLQAREFDEEEEDEEEQPAAPRQQGYHSFAPKVRGVLYKISPLSEEICADIETYMKEGFMKRDLTFVDTLYGLVAPSQRKEFSMFWESPWVEEQINEAAKRRKVEQQQKHLAVRSYIKARTQQQDGEDVDQFLSTVSRLTEWDAGGNEQQAIKTVSRMVQSFEKKAILSLISLLEAGTIQNPAALSHLHRLRGPHGDVDPVTHALRRAPYTYVAFANLVAAELLLAEGTNGSRNTTINMSRRLDLEKFNAVNTMLDKLQKASVAVLPKDTMGLPLMQTTHNVCVSRGVLVVSGKAAKATYVLDIENLDEVMQKKLTKSGEALEITARYFDDEEGQPKQKPARKKKGKKPDGGLGGLV
jgi:hypothetical protein